MATRNVTPGWTEIAADPDFLGGDLEIGNDALTQWPDGQWKQRGPIKSITILNQDEDGGILQIEMEWVACRRDNNDDWVWAPTLDKVVEVHWNKWSQLHMDNGRFRFTLQQEPCYKSALIYPIGLDRLDAAQVMTEYHLATHVRHNLYPPDPYEDIEHVGLIQTHGSGCKIITFVVHAFALEDAEAWCRGECARLNLPIIGMKKTHLLPGY